MAQGQRRGLERTREVFLEYHLGRKQKERTREVARSSEAKKLDVMVMTWAQREARSRVYPPMEDRRVQISAEIGMQHGT